MEQVCLLCRRADADPELCGLKLEAQGLCAHQCCLVFANKLFQREAQDNGLMGFRPEDICRIVVQAEQKNCFVCRENRATITCRSIGCNRSFHFPCALEGGCVTQFFGLYRSYCWEHRPQQELQAAPENTTCLICLEPVDDTTSYGTMVCPACQHAWFHRGCIQGQAMSAGISCFQCPLCRDKDRFVSGMLILGICVPFRMPLWENNNAYADLGDRHSRCDARVCLCPQGREHREGRGPWQLFLCRSCAAEGTHRGCFGLRTTGAFWECDSCAGLGTASSASSELADTSTTSQAPSGPSQTSLAPESSSPSTASQEASGPSLGSPAPETTSPSTTSQEASGPSHSSRAPETSSPSTASQEASGPSHGSSDPENGGRSSSIGPVRTRDRSRLQRRAQNPYSRPRRPSERSDTPAPSAESSTHGQELLGPSHLSPIPESNSPSTDSEEAPGLFHSTLAEESSRPSTTCQLPLGSSSTSTELQSSGRSSHAGPVRTRGRSRLQRRAENPYSRPGRHRGTSHGLSPSAESSTPSQDVQESSVSLVSETSNPSTSSQEASGPSHSSVELEAGSPRTDSQGSLGSSSSSTELESGQRSRSPGPVRTRGRSRLQRRAQHPYSRPRRRRGTIRARSRSAGPDPPAPAQ